MLHLNKLYGVVFCFVPASRPSITVLDGVCEMEKLKHGKSVKGAAVAQRVEQVG